MTAESVIPDMPITDVRDRLSDVVNRAAFADGITYVTRRGRRVAAIVPAGLVDHLKAVEDAYVAAGSSDVAAFHSRACSAHMDSKITAAPSIG